MSSFYFNNISVLRSVSLEETTDLPEVKIWSSQKSYDLNSFRTTRILWKIDVNYSITRQFDVYIRIFDCIYVYAV